MDTYIEVKFYTEKVIDADKIFDDVFGEISRIEHKYSLYKPNSVVNQINSSREAVIDEETYKLLSYAIFVSSLTSGAFDITVFPLSRLWAEGIKSKEPPSDELIESLKTCVDFRRIKLTKLNEKKFKVKLLPPLKGIDLGGIAKGYAIYSAAKVLESHGLNTYLINAGGDIYCHGDRIWRIGLQHPRKPFGEIMGIIELKNTSVCTSGDYERYFINRGKRFHHIVDPKSGYPSTGFISATVVFPNPVISDALSTGIFVLGYNEEVLNRITRLLEGLDYILIDEDLKVYKSEGLKKFSLSL